MSVALQPARVHRRAEPARRREPHPAVRPAARARAVRDRFGARDRHLAVARVDPPRAAARGGVRARPAQGDAVASTPSRPRPLPGTAQALPRRGVAARPTRRSSGDQKRLRELDAERRGGLPESVADEFERDYSPGRTWQSLAVGHRRAAAARRRARRRLGRRRGGRLAGARTAARSPASTPARA